VKAVVSSDGSNMFLTDESYPRVFTMSVATGALSLLAGGNNWFYGPCNPCYGLEGDGPWTYFAQVMDMFLLDDVSIVVADLGSIRTVSTSLPTASLFDSAEVRVVVRNGDGEEEPGVFCSVGSDFDPRTPVSFNQPGFAMYSAEKKTLTLILCPNKELEPFRKVQVHPHPEP